MIHGIGKYAKQFIPLVHSPEQKAANTIRNIAANDDQGLQEELHKVIGNFSPKSLAILHAKLSTSRQSLKRNNISAKAAEKLAQMAAEPLKEGCAAAIKHYENKRKLSMVTKFNLSASTFGLLVGLFVHPLLVASVLMGAVGLTPFLKSRKANHRLEFLRDGFNSLNSEKQPKLELNPDASGV